jgi:CheY-like chemotaxis protein
MPAVLLVEDESPLLEHLRSALELAGYTVLGATSGVSALRICQAYHDAIDVLISDVLMYPLTGFEVAAIVKSAHPNAIVILTSGSPPYAFSGPIGADDFLENRFSTMTGGSHETWN